MQARAVQARVVLARAALARVVPARVAALVATPSPATPPSATTFSPTSSTPASNRCVVGSTRGAPVGAALKAQAFEADPVKLGVPAHGVSQDERASSP